MIQAFCTERSGDATLAEFIGPLAEKAKEWQALTMEIGRKAMAAAAAILMTSAKTNG